MNDLRPLINSVFVVLMGALMPVRKRGAFGTSHEPVYFDEGDTVPWWLECRWPLHMDLTFSCDVETYYEDGNQVVRPLWKEASTLMEADLKGWKGQITGCPTLLMTKPRKPPRAPIKVLELIEEA